jgi:phage shock protein PspC (stress-responsive transcriptional regulator)
MNGSVNRLMRSRTNKLLSGVAGGLAAYLLIDVVYVRLGLVLLSFSGVGILLYPILWLIMPLEPEAHATWPQSPTVTVPNTVDMSEQVRRRSFILLLVAVGMLCLAMLLPVVGDLFMALGGFMFPLLLIGLGIMLIRRER